MVGPGENGETSKFLWSLSLLIRPEWYADSYINTCLSDLKRFGITKKYFSSTNVEKFSLLQPSFLHTFLPRSYPVSPGVS